MADSGEGKVSLDDSLCEEDFSPTQMPEEPLKQHRISNTNNNDNKYGSSSEDKDLQTLVTPDPYSFYNYPTSVHLQDNASTQKSPSILTNLQTPPLFINVQKRKPIFGTKNKSHSSRKFLVTKKTPAATSNNGGNNLSTANGRKVPSDKCSKGATSGREKSKEKPASKDASKQAIHNKFIKEPTTGVKLKAKLSPKSSSKKKVIKKSTEEKKSANVGTPKKMAPLTAEEKAIEYEQKKLEKVAKNRDKEQKKIESESERKGEENERLKGKILKRQKECSDSKKADCELQKSGKKFSKGRANVDEQNKKEQTFITQRAKAEKTKASAQKMSGKHPGMKDVLKISPKPILEEDDMESVQDLRSQDPTEVAISIFSNSPQSGPSNNLSEDMGSPAHVTYLKFKNSVTCNDSVLSVVRNPKKPLADDTPSTGPFPKRAKLDSNVRGNFTYQTTSLKTSSKLKNGSVGLHPKERNKKTKFDGGTRPLQKKRTCKKANTTGPVWVKCCNTWCQKWRQLKDHFDPLTVPTFWKCTENSDKDCNDCSKPMEQWDNLEDDDFQFVESAYVPGSLVWAKLESYPWWPAMVEADPDEECYYEMEASNSHVPVKYHVVFFDTPVSRSWIQANRIVPFADVTDANKEHRYRVVKKYEKHLDEGVKQANEALKIDVKERRNVYGFSTRRAAQSKNAAPLRKRPNTNPNRATKMKISKRNLKGEEREVEVMAKKEEVETGKEDIMEWEKGESDEQSIMLLQPED